MTDRDPRLFIWPKLPKDSPKILAIKKIVEELSLPYAVKPFWYDVTTSEEARRVLVLEDGFENGPVVDYIYPKSPKLAEEAVEWALGLRESRGARTAEDTMARILGAGLALTVWDEVRVGEEWVRVEGDGGS